MIGHLVIVGLFERRFWADGWNWVGIIGIFLTLF